MLALSLKPGEVLKVGKDTFMHVRNDKDHDVTVKITIETPPENRIERISKEQFYEEFSSEEARPAAKPI